MLATVKEKNLMLCHPTGNPNSRNAAIAFQKKDLLGLVVTSFAYQRSSLVETMLKFIPRPYNKRAVSTYLKRAWIPPKSNTRCNYYHLYLQIIERLPIARWFRAREGSLQDRLNYCFDSFAAQLLMARDDINVVYSYEDISHQTFSIAKQQGKLCIYELPTLYFPEVQRIYEEEGEKFPEFQDSMSPLSSSKAQLNKKRKELELADLVVVPSQSVKNSLTKHGIAEDNIKVIPYGAPTDYFTPQVKESNHFKALYIGALRPTKGVHYLLSAWNQLDLPDAELLLIGKDEFPSGWLRANLGKASHHPPVPHRMLDRFYSQAHIFLSPSLIEGLALVSLEALACGTAVIATEMTGLGGLLTDGKEGFIVESRNIEMLKDRIKWCYDNRGQVNTMGTNARNLALSISWESYHKNIVGLIQNYS